MERARAQVSGLGVIRTITVSRTHHNFFPRTGAEAGTSAMGPNLDNDLGRTLQGGDRTRGTAELHPGTHAEAGAAEGPELERIDCSHVWQRTASADDGSEAYSFSIPSENPS